MCRSEMESLALCYDCSLDTSKAMDEELTNEVTSSEEQIRPYAA